MKALSSFETWKYVSYHYSINSTEYQNPQHQGSGNLQYRTLRNHYKDIMVSVADCIHSYYLTYTTKIDDTT
jgi:hypothetical protein